MNSQLMLSPFEVLYQTDRPALPLPAELQGLYGGMVGLDEPSLYANFVSSIDGVVSIPSLPGSVQMIGGQNTADRFLMALLRATADALLLGATTFRASREAHWTAENMYPPAAAAFGELRRRLRHTKPPELAVVTASGNLDPGYPALEAGALILTTAQGAERLGHRLPGASTVLAVGPRIDLPKAVTLLRARGHQLILSEGGPTLLGSLLTNDLVDQLFLTVSPTLAGHPHTSDRLSLTEGAELLPGHPVHGQLLSLHRHGDYVFLRYQLKPRD
jgi:riboflavin biosynthesis pyrimidine reductase